MRFYVPSRPVRYAMVLTHTLRSRLDDIDVDLTRIASSEAMKKVERSIADKVDAMSAKIEALETRLAEYEEGINGPSEKPKAKAKSKARPKRKASK